MKEFPKSYWRTTLSHAAAGVLYLHSSGALPPVSQADANAIYLPVIATECTPGAFTPIDVLDLDNQKLTLSTDGDDEGDEADEVTQPALCVYVDLERFFAGTDEYGNYVEMGINTSDDDTTGDTKYTRLEFREMTENGQVEAGWKSNSGKHTLQAKASFVGFALDKDQKKIETSLFQIHGISDDIQVRAKRDEGKINIVLHYDDADGEKQNFPFIEDYQEGTLFEMSFVVENNVLVATVNGVAHQIPMNPEDVYYFKGGPYQNGKPVSGRTVARIYQYGIGHQ